MAKHSGGRPTKYNEKYHVPWVRSLARRGLTVEEMADAMGVAVMQAIDGLRMPLRDQLRQRVSCIYEGVPEH